MIKRLGGMVAILVLAGCATFEGPVPVDADWDVVWLSPANGDGVYDELTIAVDVPTIRGLRIQSYRFAVTDSRGRIVHVVEDSLPSDTGGRGNMGSLDVPSSFSWDGRDGDGAWAPDGEYRFRIEAKAQKGLSGVSPEGLVRVDNTAPSAVLSVPFTTFSPNGDGRQDTLPVYLQEASVEDLWEGLVISESGDVVRSTTWTGLPGNTEWDGRGDDGRRLPDGLYTYRAASTDAAGNRFSLDIPGLRLDTSPSDVVLERSEDVISPNGDGVLDGLELSPTLRRNRGIVTWTMAVVDTAGRSLRSWTGRDVPGTVVFDGLDTEGRRIPDGEYFGTLVIEYENGDAPEAATSMFTVDTVPPSAVFSAAYTVFSPEGDGRRDDFTVNQSSSPEGLWTARILDSTGRIVRSGSWETRLTPFTWDGRNDAGRIVADGLYSYEVAATDRGGNAYSGGIGGIRVDTRPTPVGLRSGTTGLSPNGDGIAETIRFVPTLTIREGLSSWTLSAENRTEKGHVWTVSHVGPEAPPEWIEWNGRTDAGRVVDGRYAVTMVVEYEKGNRSETVLDTEIRIDTTSPQVAVTVSPQPFSPDDDGYDDVLTITPSVIDESRIRSWSVSIDDPVGTPFYRLARTGAVVPVAWNGRSDSGELVLSAEDYGLTVEAVDEFGNRGSVETRIPVDILVIRDGNRLRISISSIYFKPYTADYRDVPEVVAQKNLETLDRLSEILKKYPQHRIQLEGHAVRVLWYDESLWRTEEQDKLAPLSTARAEAIRDALIRRGIAAARMTTTGYGGTRPLVPHSDEVNRWKNRRVEFILIR